MEEIEIWKLLDFLGFPNYEVSNFGRVKSLNYKRTGEEKILKQSKVKNDYLHVVLYQNGKRKIFKIHKLVALAFIPNDNPTEKTEINHLDENKQNNNVSNLCWCSHIENINYGTRNERVCKPIQQYTKDMVFIREFDSATTASIELNLNKGNITQCCKGKLKTCGRFIWKYKEY